MTNFSLLFFHDVGTSQWFLVVGGNRSNKMSL